MQARTPNPGLVILVALVGLLSAAGGVMLWRSLQPSEPQSLLMLPESRVIADFKLVDHRNQPFSLADLRGEWSLLFFGFTHCPDVCPDTLFKLHEANEIVRDEWQKGSPPLRTVFVSVDPERDTPAAIARYVGYFDPEFTGVTGDHAQLLPLTMQLGIIYRIEEHASGADAYGVDHSTGILLVNPEGRLHGAFSAPHDPGKIAADVLAVMNSGRS